jgi:hypothetical protein
MTKQKVQLTLLIFAAVAVIGYGVHRAASGQNSAISYALAAACAAASLWALGTAAFAQLRGRRASLATPAIAGLVLSFVCLLFVRGAGPLLQVFAATNIALSAMNLARAVRIDRSFTPKPPAKDSSTKI